MAEARERAAWSRCSQLCATVVNANPFRKGQPVSPNAFNPFAALDGEAKKKETIAMPVKNLRYIFCP